MEITIYLTGDPTKELMDKEYHLSEIAKKLLVKKELNKRGIKKADVERILNRIITTLAVQVLTNKEAVTLLRDLLQEFNFNESLIKFQTGLHENRNERLNKKILEEMSK